MNKSESKYYNTALLMDEALLLLLEKKDYEFITVKEICAKAGVNRSVNLLFKCLYQVNAVFTKITFKIKLFFYKLTQYDMILV